MVKLVAGCAALLLAHVRVVRNRSREEYEQRRDHINQIPRSASTGPQRQPGPADKWAPLSTEPHRQLAVTPWVSQVRLGLNPFSSYTLGESG